MFLGRVYLLPALFTLIALALAIFLRNSWQTLPRFATPATLNQVKTAASQSRNMSTTTTRTPVYFISHGGPNLIYDTSHPAYTHLTTLGRQITTTIRPTSILIFSAHWQHTPTTISINTSPSTPLIYDFSGFPAHYYRAAFPHRGSPELAHRVLGLLAEKGISAEPAKRGLDHGVWAPLSVMFNPASNPLGDVPIVQVSLFGSEDGDAHYALGEAVASLRDEGVLVLVSGMAVHNLRDLFSGRGSAGPRDYAVSFDEALREAVESEPGVRKGVMAGLLGRGDARSAHPSFEHLLPVFVGAGAAGADGGVRTWTLVEGSMSWGMFRFGDLPGDAAGDASGEGGEVVG